MGDHLKSFFSNRFVYQLVRPVYRAFLIIYDPLRMIFFRLFPEIGKRNYNLMQQRQYKRYTGSYEDAMKLCVGQFNAHESYPYEKYLLDRYEGSGGHALDFACGVGRMINRMLPYFDVVDGVDLSSENIEYARRYLKEKGHADEKFNLYQSSGVGVKINNTSDYDFIYSTIALQHISVYEIRHSIFQDLFDLLKSGGSCCFQMGFGWDNGIHWFDNQFSARTTNAGNDVSVPDQSHLPKIKNGFENIGFKDITFEFKLSPHPELGNIYHPIWLFIHMKK